jgi:pSer/pThr/pTyr-binding forkhead associated (FHA) protein
MVQLQLLTGNEAGSTVAISQFPFVVGRGAEDDLRIEEAGVWERHLQLDFVPKEGFTLAVLPAANASLNGQPVEQCLLKNGDIIEAGAVKLQFWLAPVRQVSLAGREVLTWVFVGLLCTLQVALAYLLLQ